MYLSGQHENPSQGSSITKKIISLAYNTGLIRAGRQLWANSLTVLNYHRIDELQNNPDNFQPNISATPADFDQQMSYLSHWFAVVSLQDVTNWILRDKPLPRYAALITFDDGYLDNYTNAFPILKKYNFPAVIYLTSGHIDSNRPFYWDLVAYCFTHTEKDKILFPDGIERGWVSLDEKNQISKQWIESMKILKEDQKQHWISKIPENLNVSIPDNYFKNLMMNWNQVREMNASNIDFGAHTVTHPILTRISPEQVRTEISDSKKKIEQELGKPVTSLAYPNGMKADFNDTVINLTKETGFSTAFTLLNGPATSSEVKKMPYTIRRSFISHKHSMSQFSTLISPLNRLRTS